MLDNAKQRIHGVVLAGVIVTALVAALVLMVDAAYLLRGSVAALAILVSTWFMAAIALSKARQRIAEDVSHNVVASPTMKEEGIGGAGDSEDDPGVTRKMPAVRPLHRHAHGKPTPADSSTDGISIEENPMLLVAAAPDLRPWFYECIRGMPYAALLTDQAGNILLSNNKANLLYRYESDTLEGQPLAILVPERYRKHDAHSHQSSIIRPTTGKLGVASIYTGLRRDGTEFPMEFLVSDIDFPDGSEVLYLFVEAADRKRVESWFELAVEASPTGMLIVNGAGGIVLANQQASRLFGYEKSELVGKEVEQLVPERYRPAHPGLRESYLKQPEVRSMGVGRDLFGRRSDGTEFPVEIGLNPLNTPDGVMVLCSIVDITERKNAEFELAHRADDLVKTNAELDDFAYIASHDLQEPLLKVQSFGDLLVQEYDDKLGEEGKSYVRRMQSATSRMKALITDLLSYSRVTRSKERFVPTDLAAIIREVMDDLEVRIKELGAQITLNDLPVIAADAIQMRQLFQNVLSNSLKYHHPGRPPVITVTGNIIKIKLKRGRGSELVKEVIEIKICDNGIGFNNVYAEEIFKPFRRLHGKSEYEGTGIGLAICKKIVARHGGEITAIGVPNEGATFVIIIPKNREDTDTKRWN